MASSSETDLLIEADTVDEVTLSSLVVMKIIKHTKENLPTLVNGQLLGLDVGTTLEVTNCLPFPSIQNEYDGEEEGADYQIEMMRCLRDVNIDHNTVGWYQTTYMGSFINDQLIETQFSYQSALPKSVVVVYDPLKSTQGALALKAFRLTEAFMQVFADGIFTSEGLKAAKVSHTEILEEVKLTVHNSILVDALLAELADLARDLQRPRLDLPQASYLEKNLEMLIDFTDDLLMDHGKHQKWQRKKNYHETQKAKWVQARIEENAQREERGESLLSEDPSGEPQFAKQVYHEPSRFDSLVLSAQIDQFCQQVDGFSGQSFGKLFLLNGLQQ